MKTAQAPLNARCPCREHTDKPFMLPPMWRKNGRYYRYGLYQIYWRKRARNYAIGKWSGTGFIGVSSAKTIEEAKTWVESTTTLEQA